MSDFEKIFDYKANDPFSVSYPFRNAIHLLVERQMKHHYDAFPFIKAVDVSSYMDDSIVCAKITDSSGAGLAEVGKLKKAKDLMLRTKFPNYEELKKTFGPQNYSIKQFVYCGPVENEKVCSNHFLDLVVPWLNEKIVPVILDDNKKRVLDAIPSPPSYNLENILSNIYVMEDEVECTQGTCFHLKGIGLITCQHALSKNLFVFSHRSPQEKFPLKTISENETIDIGHVESIGLELNDGLDIGKTDNLNQMDHVAVAGFPNYRLGDSGSLSPGIITGFRTVSSIRRILVNAPIIAGNSGGPAINSEGSVIGVAITGSDRMESSSDTENHGIVPIDTLKFIGIKF